MKIRLDQYLVQNGLVQSRERAKALIMAGVVFVNQQKVDKAGEMIKEDAVVEVRGHDIGYVSRGGLRNTPQDCGEKTKYSTPASPPHDCSRARSPRPLLPGIRR